LVYHLVPSEEGVGILHLGADATSCLITKGGKVVRSRVIPLGADHLKGVLPKDASFDFMNFEPTSLPMVKQRAEAFRAEIARTFFSITQRGGESISQIFVSGEFDTFRNLDVYVGQGVDHPFVQLPQKSTLCDHEFRTARYAVPLGMLLDHLPRSKGEQIRPIDFRKETFAYPRPWRRARRRIATYLVMGLIAGGLFFLGIEGMVRKREGQLKATYGHLAGEGDLVANMAAKWRALNGEVESYPLVPNLPKVGDLLAWLEAHPQMEGIRVENLHYSLVKRPDHRRPQEPYQAKVELELKTQSPTKARELHDALRAPNAMVDPKHELQWHAQGERVKAVFVLQNLGRPL